MRRLAVLAIVVVGALIGAPASAGQIPGHEGDPCVSNETHPGHSAYALHHVAVTARAGGLGAGGHIPGEHFGYAGLCGVLAP